MMNIKQELKNNLRWIALKSGKTNKQVMDDIKTLTDEEINTEMLAYLNSKTMGLEDFAKAILRKAQQK